MRNQIRIFVCLAAFGLTEQPASSVGWGTTAQAQGRAARCKTAERGPSGPREHVSWTNKSEVLWQGMEHEWEHLPHRVGDLANFIDFDAAWAEFDDVEVRADAHMTYRPGQDGDASRRLHTRYRSFAHQDIGVQRDLRVFSASDHIDPERTDQRARITVRDTLVIDLMNEPMNAGCFDTYTTVLRGFEMDVDKPEGGTGYLWPTHFKIQLGECTQPSDRRTLECPIEISLTREDSPDPFKCAESELDYTFNIHLTTVGGFEEDFRATDRRSDGITGRSITDPVFGAIRAINVAPGFDRSFTAVTGLRLNVTSDWVRDGRYFKRFAFRARDGAYDPATGDKDIWFVTGVHRPAAGAYAADYDASLRTVQLQLNDPVHRDSRTVVGGSFFTETRSAEGQVCSRIGASPTQCVGRTEQLSDEVAIDRRLQP